jgi:hypothetical protein
MCRALALSAEDVRSIADQFAEQSFALLDHVSKQRAGEAGPLVGLVAGFAGDAETLRQSLGRGDLPAARSSATSLQADSAAIDQALKEHPDAIPAEQWRRLKQQADHLTDEIPPCRAGCLAPAAASGSGSGPATDTTTDHEPPRIVIALRESRGGIVHLKGYFEGRGLKSAGVYDGSSRLRGFKVDGVPGPQRVDFDLQLEDPSSATILRVSDLDGRTAEVPLLDSRLPPPPFPAAADVAADSAPIPSRNRERSAEPGEDAATAEIPSHGPLLPSPSKRHTLASKLGDVRISILRLVRVGNLPPAYELAGQIEGRGITRAGIYLNGRLLQAIPISRSANNTSFDQRFTVRAGTPTIRAYSLGSQFVEQQVDLFEAEDAAELSDYSDGGLITTAPIAPAGIAVQITSIRPLAGGLYLVSGVVSGADIASAGLYQNGVLAENINPSGGLAGVLGALMPGSARSINFNVRFNPYAGPAAIRAFNRTGAFTEQPIVVAGIPPYGAAPPSSPYGVPLVGGPPANMYRNRLGSSRPLW